jgi:hypothetical protein
MNPGSTQEPAASTTRTPGGNGHVAADRDDLAVLDQDSPAVDPVPR